MIATAFGEWKNSTYPGRYRVERKMQLSGEAWAGKMWMMAPQSISACLEPTLRVLELNLSCKGQLWMPVTSLGATGVGWTHWILGALPTLSPGWGETGDGAHPFRGSLQADSHLWHSQLLPKNWGVISLRSFWVGASAPRSIHLSPWLLGQPEG